MAEVIVRHGRIDILVTNAGRSRGVIVSVEAAIRRRRILGGVLDEYHRAA